ncbi:hypothetical protein [Lysobacter firmicutimachus]|uniref:Transmembrane protein n=1 Tax=Lysobacter firmicutimachus TaxID=1792846 RepID=A0ABU8CZF5_9GAMM
MNKALIELTETERLLRPNWIAVLLALVLHMNSAWLLLYATSEVGVGMPVVTMLTSIATGIMLIVVAALCIRCLLLCKSPAAFGQERRGLNRYDKRSVQLASVSTILCLSAAGALFVASAGHNSGAEKNALVDGARFLLVCSALYSAVKSLQLGAAHIETTSALNHLGIRSS